MWGVVAERTINAFAALILFVNVVGLLLSFVAGDPRLMLAKDSGISSAVGIGILVSLVMGKPMMTAGMKPFLVKGTRRGTPRSSGCSVGRRPFSGPSGGSRWCGV